VHGLAGKGINALALGCWMKAILFVCICVLASTINRQIVTVDGLVDIIPVLRHTCDAYMPMPTGGGNTQQLIMC